MGLQPTLFFLVSGNADEGVLGGRISSGERVVELLDLGRGQFLQADEHFSNARQAIDRLNLSVLSPDLILYADDLDTYYQELTQTNNILLNGPDLLTNALGLNEERSYLILSQNSDELRPSGGYISTYGWLTIRNGRVINYNYSPTTDISPNPPAANASTDFTVPDWWIQYSQPIYAAWDGSWYVDFPSTAAMAKWYYDAGNNPNSPVYGVISIDMIGFERLLEAMGSVAVEGYDQVVTPDNFRDIVYGIRVQRHELPGSTPHKEFLAALYKSIFDKWQTIGSDPEIGPQLLGAVLAAVQEKHIMLYFADDTLNSAVNTLGWSGAQTPALDHDYLLVADANLGNKSNHSIIRQLTYDVDIQSDGTLESRASISYDYPDRIAANDPAVNPENGPRNYNNLLQVFVPYNSQIESTNNLTQDPRVVDLDTHTLFVSRVGVEYDTNERFQFSYQTPPLIENVGPYQRYHLLIQKQPGTIGDAVNVQVTLPANAKTIGITPDPATRYDLDRPIVEFRFVLERDQWVEIIYETGN